MTLGEINAIVLDNGITIGEARTRLRVLEQKLEQDGEYTRGNTVWLALQAIERLTIMAQAYREASSIDGR